MESDLIRKGSEEFFNCLLKRDEDREQDRRKFFVHELSVADKALKLQLEGFRTINEDATGATFNPAIQQLLTRLFNHQLAARKLLLMGYITEAASILGRALETIWLVRYFDCYPNEIDRWCDKKEKIRPAEIRKGLKRAYKDGGKLFGSVDEENHLYQDLCTIGHPDFYGSVWHMYVRSESPQQVEFHPGGYGSLERPESLKGAFKWLLKIQMLSLITMGGVNNEFIGDNRTWDTKFQSVGKDLLKFMGSDTVTH